MELSVLLNVLAFTKGLMTEFFFPDDSKFHICDGTIEEFEQMIDYLHQ